MRFDRRSVYLVALAAAMATASCSSDGEEGAGAAGGSSSASSTGVGAGASSSGPGGAGGSGSSSGGTGVGGSAAGGSSSGGSAAGGTSVGGSSSGGSDAGGSAVGGASTGGSDAGGASTGGSSTGGSSTGGASTGGSAGVGGAVTAGVGGSVACFAGSTQCTDCIDNDGDGYVDAFDVECVGPLDNDEGSFSTGIPGDNTDPCKQDCFFDGNSGAGDDGCNWNLKCDPASPGAPSCPYDSTYNNCPGPQSQKCIDTCQQYTPNGCDCFGCCDVTLTGGQTVTIKLGAGCTEEAATDPTVCKACTKVTSCNNTCETCEYCLGKTELPPECNPSGSGGAGGAGGAGSGGAGGSGGSSPTCDPGVQVCTMAMPCAAGSYCLTGCCVVIPE